MTIFIVFLDITLNITTSFGCLFCVIVVINIPTSKNQLPESFLIGYTLLTCFHQKHHMLA